MLVTVSRLLLLAPALAFGLGAAFVLSAHWLGASPADPDAWRTFLTLAPIIRESVYLVAGLSGMGDAAAFFVFLFAALLGLRLAFWPTKTGRSAFIYAHVGFLTLFYSMGGAGVFTAGGILGATGLSERLDWNIDFSGFPAAGVILFTLVGASCALMHMRVLGHLGAQFAKRRGRAAEAGSSCPRSALPQTSRSGSCASVRDRFST